MTETQYNVQVPMDAPLGPVSLVAVRECGVWREARSEAKTVTIELATPGFFLDPRATEYQLIAARFNSSPIAVAPPFLIGDPYGNSRPAKPGDVIDLYGTGWGKTTADLKTGELATSAAELLPEANPSASFGGIIMDPDDIIYVGIAPGAAGLMQMVMRVPENAQPGNNEVVLTVYGRSTPTGPVIPVAAP